MSEKNRLYYGDNYEVLQRYIRDESVDLIYLDPPFNSRQEYSVLFAEKDGSQSSSQIRAFKDTWEWNQESARSLEYVIEQGGRIAEAMIAFRTLLGTTDMMAYLAMMAPRLVELRRVLKETGSIYLHCDPTASHYLKILMDAVFGPQFFRNEITWLRATPRGHAYTRFASSHDVILAYGKGVEVRWNRDAAFKRYDLSALDAKTAEKYASVDSDGRRYQLTSLLNPNPNRPNLKYEFLGKTRVWRWTKERMSAAYDRGLIVQPRPGAVPRFKRYLDDQKGKPIGDVWMDIPPINSQAQERLGYPTQKPEALLERIIAAGSNEGDTVLDPFCGCGTTVQVAQRLNRRWIGIDITHLAITLIKKRLADAFPERGSPLKSAYEVVGEPTDLAGAGVLAAENKYQFQYWALGLVGARPVEQKKGADGGIDGRLYFHDDDSGRSRQILFSVKGGGVGVAQVREFAHVIRQKADLGIFLCFEQPTKPMLKEAADAGFYKSSDGSSYPRLQILTIQQLLNGQQPHYPLHRRDATFKRAPKSRSAAAETLPLPLGE